jgi:hypothetical protein
MTKVDKMEEYEHEKHENNLRMPKVRDVYNLCRRLQIPADNPSKIETRDTYKPYFIK